MEANFEFLDHTADVQIHSWGPSMEMAFEQAGIGVFGYMINAGYDNECSIEERIRVRGVDEIDLLFRFLDEVLFLYAGPVNMALGSIKITRMGPIDGDLIELEACCRGEPWKKEKHARGTEIKAITFSNMQVLYVPEMQRYECYFIVDI